MDAGMYADDDDDAHQLAWMQECMNEDAYQQTLVLH